MSPLQMPNARAHGRTDIAAVVLAAGCSMRFGESNKLLSAICGRPMISRVVETVRASGVDIIHVVVGHQAERVQEALRHLGITVVDNPHYDEGMASSVVAGIESLPGTVGAAFVVLGDMPLLDPSVFAALIAAHRHQPDLIGIPCLEGKRGNPVLWPRPFFERLLRLKGDSGGRSLFKEFGDQVNYVEVETDAIFMDVDYVEALNAVRERSNG